MSLARFENTILVPQTDALRAALMETKEKIHRHRMEEREGILDRYTGRNVSGLHEDHGPRLTNERGESISSHHKRRGRHEKRVADYFTAKTLTLAKLAEHNIIRHVINREAMVYKDAPVYTYDTGEENKEGQREFVKARHANLPDFYNPLKRWMRMRKAEKRTRLLGTGLVGPVWRGNGLDWDYVHNYRIITTNDPFEPAAVLIPLNMHTDSFHIHGDQKWAYWDAERHFIWTPSTGTQEPPSDKNPEMENPYGILPFISVHPDDQDDSYWVESPQLDIVNAMDSLNKGVTEGRIGVRYAMGQRTVSGANMSDGEELVTGMDILLDLPTGADYNHVSTPSDFEGLIKMIKFDLTVAFENHGLGPVFADPATREASGFALTVRNLPLAERRDEDLGRWRTSDAKIYEVEKRIVEVESGSTLPEKRMVDYAEPEHPISPQEEREQDDWDLEHGLTSLPQLMMRRDPDRYKTPEMAIAAIEKNKGINQALGTGQVERPNAFERRARRANATVQDAES